MFQPNQHRTHGLGYETPGRVFVQRIRIDRVRNEPRSILFLMLFYWPCNEHQLPLHVPFVRAHSKITSHFKRRCILAGCVTKARNMLDCAAFVPCQTGASTLKLANLFLSEPLEVLTIQLVAVGQLPKGCFSNSIDPSRPL